MHHLLLVSSCLSVYLCSNGCSARSLSLCLSMICFSQNMTDDILQDLDQRISRLPPPFTQKVIALQSLSLDGTRFSVLYAEPRTQGWSVVVESSLCTITLAFQRCESSV